MLVNIIEGQRKDLHALSIVGIVLASITIILNILILKAYNKNDKFEKPFRDIQLKSSENFVNNLVKDALKVCVAKTNDSKLTVAENLVKKEAKIQKEPKLKIVEQNINHYEPELIKRQQSCVSPAFEYIKPGELEEEQDQMYNSSLVLMMTSIKMWTSLILSLILLGL